MLSELKITEQLYDSWGLRDSLPNVLFCLFLIIIIKKEKGKIYFQVNHRQILVELNTVKKKIQIQWTPLLFCWLKNHNCDYIYIHHFVGFRIVRDDNYILSTKTISVDLAFPGVMIKMLFPL